jgi:hypothetical protein
MIKLIEYDLWLDGLMQEDVETSVDEDEKEREYPF